MKELDEQRRHSITFDNGTEFARCHRLEKHLDMKLYFADPGCPYQRGTNENTNGLIRQYFPKGTDFRDVTHHEVRRVEKLLNNRPRACLGFSELPTAFSSRKLPPVAIEISDRRLRQVCSHRETKSHTFLYPAAAYGASHPRRESL